MLKRTCLHLSMHVKEVLYATNTDHGSFKYLVQKTRLWDTPNGQTLLCWQLLGKGTKLGTKKYLQFHDN